MAWLIVRDCDLPASAAFEAFTILSGDIQETPRKSTLEGFPLPDTVIAGLNGEQIDI